jgi:large subunit ribosomal protein L15
LGIGESSGHGKTSGRGGKGQTARSGGTIRLGFEGGQMPLLRRIPKRGFNNASFRTVCAIVNVEQLNSFENGATVTPESLVEAGLVKKLCEGVKILGNGELNRKLTVKVQRVSASAREKIARAGGQWEELPLRTIHHKPETPSTEAKTTAGAK